MNPILLSLLLGTAAAAANVFGGTIIVKRNWDRSYLKYFVALGAGFMLATAVLEIIPASFDLREKDAPILILAGYLITHFFEHTVTPHFHFGEETHADQFVTAHKGYSVKKSVNHQPQQDGVALVSSHKLVGMRFFAEMEMWRDRGVKKMDDQISRKDQKCSVFPIQGQAGRNNFNHRCGQHESCA